MIAIGWRNLRRAPARLAIAVCGVAFAVLLITVEVGMLLGLVRNASILIDRSGADIWVSKTGVRTIDFATPFDNRKRFGIASIPGVDRVEELNVSFAIWKLPSGGNTSTQVIGLETRGELMPRLEMAKGCLEDLHNQDAVIIDESERAKLGHVDVGDTVEIMGRQARVVGVTRGMKSFATTPFVFCSLARSRAYGWITRDMRSSTCLLVKVQPGFDIEQVRKAIERNFDGIEAHTRKGFSYRTRRYWLLETGVGIGYVVAGFLGLLVGGVVVSQTLLSMTVDKLPEFGLLMALGAPMDEISRIIVQQALICGACGLTLGFAASYGFQAFAAKIGATVVLPWGLLVIVCGIGVSLCSLAAIISITRLRRLDPAIAFSA